jgi:hypothetical protein
MIEYEKTVEFWIEKDLPQVLVALETDRTSFKLVLPGVDPEDSKAISTLRRRNPMSVRGNLFRSQAVGPIS